MLEQRKLSDMLELWLDEMLEFDFSVEQIPGVTNVLPDCLSRLYKSAPPSSSAPTVCLAVPTIGSPVGWCPGDYDEGPVEVSRMADWVPPMQSTLGGGSESEDH